MSKKENKIDQIPRSAMKPVPLSKKFEILWDRMKLKYGGHRTWIIVKTGPNKRTHTWITIREIMRVMEENYDKEKVKAESTGTD